MKKHKYLKIFAPFLFVVAAWVLGHRLVLFLVGGKLADAGLFGDSYGAINTLFSGLAFAGVIVALFLQTEELGLQRNDLELTRKELQGSRQAQERSQVALSRQADMLLATARLNATRSVYDSIDPAKMTVVFHNFGDNMSYNREKCRQYLEILLNELPGPPREPVEAIMSSYGCYMWKIVRNTRLRLGLGASWDPGRAQYSLEQLFEELQILYTQDGLIGSNDEQVLQEALLILWELLDNFREWSDNAVDGRATIADSLASIETRLTSF